MLAKESAMNRFGGAVAAGATSTDCITLGDILSAAEEVSTRDAAALVERFLATRRVRFVRPAAQRTLDLLSVELDPRSRAYVA
jgi:hypothetical protein